MKKISFFFNQHGNFLQIAINHSGVKFLFALAIPYPFYGWYAKPNRFEPKKKCFHFRYIRFVLVDGKLSIY